MILQHAVELATKKFIKRRKGQTEHYEVIYLIDMKSLSHRRHVVTGLETE